MNNGENFGTRPNFFDDSNFINLFIWFLIGPKSFHIFQKCVKMCETVITHRKYFPKTSKDTSKPPKSDL